MKTPTLKTLAGRLIEMLAPTPQDIDLADIARGLCTQVRFAGHINRYHYSVAEHSVRVAARVRSLGASVEMQRAALLHDAAEAYLGDLIGPLKHALRQIEERDRSSFDFVEDLWLEAIGARFGVGLVPLPREVKLADAWMLCIEDRDLRGIPLPAGVESGDRVHALVPQLAEEAFLSACQELGIR